MLKSYLILQFTENTFMNAHTLKQDALESFQRLPDDVDVDEMMYQLYVIDKLHKSREAIKQGDVINHDDFKREMQQW
ncbi:MAG: hypothetical protein RIS84_1909 [Pseudomonadota bacterium]